ncbi:MAG: hypothetical protein ACK544_13225, partial [Microcystis sp.]
TLNSTGKSPLDRADSHLYNRLLRTTIFFKERHYTVEMALLVFGYYFWDKLPYTCSEQLTKDCLLRNSMTLVMTEGKGAKMVDR